ncbi:MAG: prepilin-type N-terminal cleavage/methylation domain-containing protein [Thiomicrorhabdus sp.]|nr:prepilin-type N-terminal cleavage/methylation domain-containing protein [Thiomicrorhabdus sp.]
MDIQKQLLNQKGFTLVEMSIVLVIIGLILGAVSIGKDLQRDAEYSKIKQKFVDGWVQSYNLYYKRTGVVLGDNQAQPRLMINGANFNLGADGGAVPLSGGVMTGATEPAAICQGGAGPKMERAADATVTMHALFDRAGIRMPPGRAEGLEDRYLYLDTNGNPQEVQVCFQWNKPTEVAGSGNVMVLTGLTPDLARALDQMIDGKADAGEGMFRQQEIGDAYTGSQAAGLDWQANNAMPENNANIANNPDDTTLANRGKDESQVRTVVAYYQMNQ